MITSSNSQPPTDRPAFSPNALLNAINNSLVSPLFNQVVRVKGIYKVGKGKNYSGYFYDQLRDEATDANITLIVPEKLRPCLGEGQFIEVLGYLTKRQEIAGGRIELAFTLTEVTAKKERTIDEETLKMVELINKKAARGFKDPDSFIRKRLFAREPVSVTIIIGLTGIIDKDIQHGLREATNAFEIRFVRYNLSQVSEILQAFDQNDGADILVISRGGGEHIRLFDHPALSERILTLRSIFVTALGHSVDEPLLQKVADKAFITPTALGQYFLDCYTRTLDEFQHSRAQLIDDVTKQVALSYSNQLRELNFQLMESRKIAEDTTRGANRQLYSLTSRLTRIKTLNSALGILLLLLLLILLGVLLTRK